MSSYSATLTYLYGLQHRGMKFGLRNIRSLLESVGHPESSFPSIHIAGTNGKGSTASFLASVMMEAGYRTGLYTSPHLLRFTERVRINGREIPENRLVDYATALRPEIERTQATFFEATTSIAFRYFADEGVDVAVVEAGLGGRLDSTNVLIPLASVITNIGFDHTEILGKTIRAIAREKAGIIKSRVPCVTSSENTGALNVLQRTAGLKHSTLRRAQRVVKCTMERYEDPVVTFRSPSFVVRNVHLGMTGLHQLRNAQLAVATIEVLRNSSHWPLLKRINNSRIRAGLENVMQNSRLRGRFEQVGLPPRYILDVAHNPDGIRALVGTLRSRGYGSVPVVFGVMRDKDYSTMIRELSSISQTMIAVAPSVKRAFAPGSLFRHIRREGIPVRRGGTVAEGMHLANRIRRKGSPILVTGSHYVVGEALQRLTRKRA